ncbi:MAG: biotin--[acetyl-CoA-carboxylase] ligase [Bacteroidota bacterium]
MSQILGKYIRRFDSLPSTNVYAQSLLGAQPEEGTLILADHQSQGKGQKGRVWEVAPSQNLTFSLITYPRFISPTRMFILSKAVALAVRHTLADFLPHAEVQVKWPNDILINHKKASGILIENQLEGNQIKSSIWGIGVNVNQHYFPPHLQHKATSLGLWTEKEISREEVLFKLIEYLNTHYHWLKSGKSESLDHAYLRHLLGYQEDILVEIKGQQETCHLAGVDAHGRLALVRNDKLSYFAVGEVSIIPDFFT